MAQASQLALTYPWILKAKSYLGEKEMSGVQDNPWILECFKFTNYGRANHDEVPWCAAFICRVLAESGYSHTHSASAESYANYGLSCELKPGAIGIIQTAIGHHVTFIVDFENDGLVPCLGGNQGNIVDIANFKAESFFAFRWPVKYS